MALVSDIAKYKLVFLGDKSVGKTSIITRFVYDKFDNTYKETTGMDFHSKTMYFKDPIARLQIWDTAGHKRFKMRSYIRDSYVAVIRDYDVAVIVYDVTSRQSFLNTAKWIENVRSERGSNDIIVLVGNKTDLVDKRKVSMKEAEAKARDLSVMFIETSARDADDFNIKALFRKMIAALAGMETLSSAELDEMFGNASQSDTGTVTPEQIDNTEEINGNASHQSDTSTVTPEQIDDTEEALERINSSRSDTSTLTPEEAPEAERISSPREISGPMQPQRKAPGRFVYLFCFILLFLIYVTLF